MATNKDNVRIINKIYTLLQDLNDEDFKELLEMSERQCEYYNPLKPGTSKKQNKLGEYNKRVITDLKKLKETFESGKDLGDE